MLYARINFKIQERILSLYFIIHLNLYWNRDFEYIEKYWFCRIYLLLQICFIKTRQVFNIVCCEESYNKVSISITAHFQLYDLHWP